MGLLGSTTFQFSLMLQFGAGVGVGMKIVVTPLAIEPLPPIFFKKQPSYGAHAGDASPATTQPGSAAHAAQQPPSVVSDALCWSTVAKGLLGSTMFQFSLMLQFGAGVGAGMGTGVGTGVGAGAGMKIAVRPAAGEPLPPLFFRKHPAYVPQVGGASPATTQPGSAAHAAQQPPSVFSEALCWSTVAMGLLGSTTFQFSW